MVEQGSSRSRADCPGLCFDELLKSCFPCNLYKPLATTGADNISSSPETATQVTNTSLTSLSKELFAPDLLLGVPIGLALLLVMLYGLLVCLLQRQLGRAPIDAEAGPCRELAHEPNLCPHEELKISQIQNRNLGKNHDQHPLQECDGTSGTSSGPNHSFPVPATELGAMVLVTTKTTTKEL